MRQYVKAAAGLFFVLCVVFIPFVHKPLQVDVTASIFGQPVQWLCRLLYTRSSRIDFSSDTRGLLLLVLILALAAAVLAFALKKYSQELLPALKTVTVYFLAFVMLKYGVDKVFLRQFYQPAPNILYTPLGNLDPDMLYWSTIGTAPAYQFVMGAVEVLAGLLLLFARTRFAGLLLAIITLLQVVIINFTFDISVKMFSLLLLAMALYVAWGQLRALFAFLLTQKATPLPKPQTTAMPVYIRVGLKCFIISSMLLVSVYPQLVGQRQTPVLHGAYQVTGYNVNGKSIALHNAPVKRVFVHPKSYIIFQAQDDAMADYYFIPGSTVNKLELFGYNGLRLKLGYTIQNGTVTFYFSNGAVITATALPWQKMPALQPQFHFMVDSVQ
jgi:hypothetical protein